MTPALDDLDDLGGRIDASWLVERHYGVLAADAATVAELRAFVMERWLERAAELGLPAPTDLSSSCKFGALFCKSLLGGEIRGSFDHLYAFVDGRVVDLSEGAADVAALAEPYRNDPAFLGSEDLAASLESCLPRVTSWIEGYLRDRRPSP